LPTATARLSRVGKDGVMKSGSRDKAEGTVDKIAGRVMEAFSKLTGNRSAGAKGKAARGRGAMRKSKGRAKRAK
jgi:uncharacterized protein YjbJ (UPF0337 family)